ncbi:hypothetical protein [Peijinzhouia sedimentorum]
MIEIKRKDKPQLDVTHELRINGVLIDECDVREFKGKLIADGNGLKTKDFYEINSVNFPENLILDFQEEEKINGIIPFSSLERSDDKIIFEYFFTADDLTENKDNKWAPLAFYIALEKECEHLDNVEIKRYEVQEGLAFNSSMKIRVIFQIGDLIGKSLKESKIIVFNTIRRVEISLGNFKWQDAFHKDEKLFSTELILPLLRKMNFSFVHYNHGKKEYGKDFTFKEMDKFGQIRNYGMQVKAGDVSGKVNSTIDEILGQITDAFSMPFYDVNSKSPQYISSFVVAISGKFTENSKEKIMHKINKGLIGSVYFLDKEMIIELIEKNWK